MELRAPIVYLKQFADHLQAEGISREECFAGTAVTEAMLRDPQATVSRRDCHTLFVRVGQLSRYPGITLRAASALRPTDHGFLGHAMVCAPNLRTSLKLLERFARTRAIPLDYRLQELGDGARLILQPSTPVGRAYREYMEWGLMIALSTVDRDSAQWRPREIALDYPEPSYSPVYADILRCPLRFGAAQCHVEFSDAVLDAATVHSNRELQQFCEQRCELILSQLQDDGDMSNRVKARLLNSPLPFPDADAVARCLNISSRVLRRRLQEEGSSFRHIVREVREELARQYLAKQDLTVEEVATLLGYSEAPAFSRAFKGWVGFSPEQYRRRQARQRGDYHDQQFEFPQRR